MRKIFLTVLCFMIVCSAVLAGETAQKLKGFRVTRFPFYVYRDFTSRINNYIFSGWTGDFPHLKIDTRCEEQPVSGTSCLKITYTPAQSGAAYGTGLCLQQNPENYWGSLRGGYDLTRAKRIFFYARGEKGGEMIEFKIGRPKKQFEMNIKGTTGVITLTREWTLHDLDISGMKLDEIAGGFCFFISRENRGASVVFYLDEIYYTDGVDPLQLSENKGIMEGGKN